MSRSQHATASVKLATSGVARSGRRKTEPRNIGDQQLVPLSENLHNRIPYAPAQSGRMQQEDGRSGSLPAERDFCAALLGGLIGRVARWKTQLFVLGIERSAHQEADESKAKCRSTSPRHEAATADGGIGRTLVAGCGYGSTPCYGHSSVGSRAYLLPTVAAATTNL